MKKIVFVLWLFGCGGDSNNPNDYDSTCSIYGCETPTQAQCDIAMRRGVEWDASSVANSQCEATDLIAGQFGSERTLAPNGWECRMTEPPLLDSDEWCKTLFKCSRQNNTDTFEVFVVMFVSADGLAIDPNGLAACGVQTTDEHSLCEYTVDCRLVAQ